MNTELNKNIKKLIEKLGITPYEFSKQIGNKRADNIYNIIKNKVEVSATTLNKIFKIYPAYKNFILTGSGEMLTTENPDAGNELIKVNKDHSSVPYYENIDVTGGILPTHSDNKEIPTFFIDYKHFNDCTAYLPVVGDSMYPKYASGEIIAVKQIFNFDMIQWGETYLIIGNENTDNIRTIKLVFPDEKNVDKLVLRASNPNFKGDTPISKCDIIALYIVKGKITRNQL